MPSPALRSSRAARVRRRAEFEHSVNETLRAEGLTKVFRAQRSFLHRRDSPRTALRDIHLTLAPGTITALVGRNGAGKTTLMRCLAGMLLPDAGHVFVHRERLDPERADLRARVGVVVADDRSFHQRLTCAQNLRFFARLHRLSPQTREHRVERSLALAQLSDRATTPYRELSTGMKRRLGFARALLGDPDALLMDEASSGLDPDAREHFHRALLSWVDERGCAVLLATHDLDEAQRLCSQVAVLEAGALRIVAPYDEALDDVRAVFPDANV